MPKTNIWKTFILLHVAHFLLFIWYRVIGTRGQDEGFRTLTTDILKANPQQNNHFLSGSGPLTKRLDRRLDTQAGNEFEFQEAETQTPHVFPAGDNEERSRTTRARTRQHARRSPGD